MEREERLSFILCSWNMLKFDHTRTLYLGKNVVSMSSVQTPSIGAAPITGHGFATTQLLGKWVPKPRATSVPTSVMGIRGMAEGAAAQ